MIKKYRIRFVPISAITLITLSGCLHKSPKMHLSNALHKQITASCNNCKKAGMVIYYFDGDCSFCIGKAIEIEREYQTKESMPVFIVRSLNPALFKYSMKENHITSCFFFERDLPTLDSINIEFNKITFVNNKMEITSVGE